MKLIKGMRSTLSRRQKKGPGKKSKSLLEEPSGVFCSTRTLPLTPPSSLATLETSKSVDSVSSTGSGWHSSGVHGFHRRSPLIVSDPEASQEITDQAAALGVALKRSRDLPTTWYFQSNHVMVNMERSNRSIAPLTRLRELDEIAADHAQLMVDEARLFHKEPQEVLDALGRPTRRLGCNVCSGTSIKDIHTGMMATTSNRNNIIDRRYTHMGMATARDTEGKLYMCQIFRG